jgi:hypothetical protein
MVDVQIDDVFVLVIHEPAVVRQRLFSLEDKSAFSFQYRRLYCTDTPITEQSGNYATGT